MYLKEQLTLLKAVSSSIKPKLANLKNKKRKLSRPVSNPTLSKKRKVAHTHPLSSLTPTKQVSQVLNQSSQMVRAIFPKPSGSLGVAKANAHSILSWLQNLHEKEIISPDKFERHLDDFSKIQNGYFECGQNPQIFYEKLSTATAYGDIEKVYHIMRTELFDY